jgi:SAM-dependent methyltransferase
MFKKVYNLGSGSRSAFRYLDSSRPPENWQEIRVDLDPDSRPDFIASLTDLSGCAADGVADAVFSSHAIEHVNDHEVETVFSEIVRILKPGGFLVLSTPDLGQVMRALDPENLEKPIYNSPAGPIRALDVLYGHRASVAAGQHYMRHHTSFTEKSLAERLMAAGFHEVRIFSGRSCDMIAIAGFDAAPDMDIVRKMYPHIDFDLEAQAEGAAEVG